MFTLHRRAAGAVMLLSAALAAAYASGCGSGAAGDDSRAEGAALASPDAGADGTAPSQFSSCSASSNARLGESLAFSTYLGCTGGAATCVANPLTLHATVHASSTSQVATWTITRGTTTVASLTSTTEDGVTVTQGAYGPDFTGIHAAAYSQQGTQLTGNVDGRAIVPTDISTFPKGGFLFADGAPAPTVSVSSAVQDGIYALMQRTRNDAAAICRVHIGTAAVTPTAALNALDASLLATPAPEPSSPPPPPQQAPRTQSDPNGVTGVPQDNDGFTDQNNAFYWATPDCQSCEGWCFKNSWWMLLGTLACEASCFIPGNGCAENLCPVVGIAACDSHDDCCGSICCGPQAVCGNNSLGACCPKDFPVACGDVTGVSCFPAGSKCCGTLTFACAADSACKDVTGTSASCCAPDHVSSQGVCCDQPTCNGACCNGTCTNGVCCGAGENVCNGKCCSGACVGGVCCDGVGQQACNGSCCDGTCCGNSCCPTGQSCTATGTCCAAGQTACGSACCGANAACVDPATSTCSAGTATLQFWNTTTNTGQQCGAAPCVEYWGYPITLRGTGYAPGNVTLTFADPAGTQTFSAVADPTGVFTTTIYPTGSGPQTVTITATEGAIKASVVASFTQII